MTKKTEESCAAAKIGKYLKYQREKREKSLNEFSRILDVDPSFLLRLEQGVYHNIGFEVVEKLARGMDMAIEDLLGKAGLLSREADELPEIEYYFKDKYQYPRQAIHDVQIFLKFVEVRYKEDIAKRRKAHKEYWSKKVNKKTKV